MYTLNSVQGMMDSKASTIRTKLQCLIDYVIDVFLSFSACIVKLDVQLFNTIVVLHVFYPSIYICYLSHL